MCSSDLCASLLAERACASPRGLPLQFSPQGHADRASTDWASAIREPDTRARLQWHQSLRGVAETEMAGLMDGSPVQISRNRSARSGALSACSSERKIVISPAAVWL